MKNIYQSIADIMQEVPSIGKDKTNKQQGFKYRGIDDVMNAFQPILAKNKVFIVPEVLNQVREERTTKSGGNLIYSICTIKFKFYAEDGSSVEAITIGEGMDSADKATNKAMAVAMKYAMFQVFCIPTEEMVDPDAETPPESKKNEQKSGVKPKTKVESIKIGQKSIDRIVELASQYADMKNRNVDELLVHYMNKYKVVELADLTEAQGATIDKELTTLIRRINNEDNK